MDQNFIQSLLSLRGKEKGQRWLDDLPETIKSYEKKWKLKSLGAFPDLSINYVEKARTNNGKDVVLKIGFPGDDELLSEMATLDIYNGEGAVKILGKNSKDCVLLLERCIPGNSLHSLNNEEEEILIFAETCRKIWKKASEDFKFKPLAGESKYFDWYFQNFQKSKDSLPKELVIKAKEKFEYLIKTQGELYLLHSDLHHDNILSSERGWLAIDPKGLIGEREYEAGVYILNPYKRFKENETLVNHKFFAKRIELISRALNFDKQRIAGWAFIKQILSLIWSLQDYGVRDTISLRNARELEKLL